MPQHPTTLATGQGAIRAGLYPRTARLLADPRLADVTARLGRPSG